MVNRVLLEDQFYNCRKMLGLDVVDSCETEMERWQLTDGIEAESGDYIGD